MAPRIKSESEIDELQTKLGVSFTNRDLLRQALTHESFVNEWSAEHTDAEVCSYERLEYLGDAVLNFTVANALFEQSRTANEGELSMGRAHIVCKDSLADAAEQLDLGDHILRGQGEIAYSPVVRDSVLEDSFEAIIGAIHVDQGFEAARNFVFEQLGEKIDNVARNGVDKDPKSAFQELVQGVGLKTPRYHTELIGIEANGQQNYRARATVDGRVVATGYGTSKSKAQKSAAFSAKERFVDGIPSEFERAVRKRRSELTKRSGQFPTRRQGSVHGSVAVGFRKVGGWLNLGVFRKNTPTSGRRLVFKRSE